MNKEALHYYEFGPFRLNATERLLQRDADVVPLTPKLVDTLVILVEHRGHVLSKDELMESLWPDSFVEESSLTQNISLLRKALNDNGNSGQYIETIPKRGYRFVAEVRELDQPNQEIILHERTSTQILIEDEQVMPEPEVSETKPRLLHVGSLDVPQRYLAALAVIIILAGAGVVAYRSFKARTGSGSLVINSVAVLPFQTIGSDSDKDVMSLGMANALIIKLSQIDQMRVLPTSSVSRFVGRAQEASQIGRDLGVDAVLDGTIQRDGDRVRVTGQMIRSSDGTTIWSGKYDTNYSNIFELQDKISSEVGTAMIPNLRKDTRDRLAGHLTDNKEAYDAYITGFYYWNRRNSANLSKAIEYLELAIQKDRNFARAHALLADSYFLASQDGYDLMNSPQSLQKAYASVQRALELDDTIAEAHTTRANVAWGNGEYALADREFRRALELNPNYAAGHLRYGYYLFGDSRINEAIAEMKRSVELDPLSPVSHTALGYMLTMSRDFDGAIRETQRAVELQADVLAAHYNLGELYMQKRMFAEAFKECEWVEKVDPFQGKVLRASIYGYSGRRDLALQMANEIRTAPEGSRLSFYELAILYATVGDKNTAFEYMDRARPIRFVNAIYRYEPKLDALRSDKRFEDILKRHTDSQMIAENRR
jgi:DNA-binding winged helix-turn-helix (wHTH) protein/TolB-like protein/Tfp pilus assembly protein PilF